MILLLYRGEVSVGFGFEAAVPGRHTPPAPLERGGSGAAFLLIMSGLIGDVSPLERGLRGV